MATLKKTASGKALQFYDDEGRVYQTSVQMVLNMIYQSNIHYITLSMLTGRVSVDRFPKSPLYDPSGLCSGSSSSSDKEPVTTTNDVLSSRHAKSRKEKRNYSDNGDFVL